MLNNIILIQFYNNSYKKKLIIIFLLFTNITYQYLFGYKLFYNSYIMNSSFYPYSDGILRGQNNVPSLAEKAMLVYFYTNPAVIYLDLSELFPYANKISTLIRRWLHRVRAVRTIQTNIRGYFVRSKIYRKLIMNDYSGDPDTAHTNLSLPILTIRAYAHNAQSVHYLYI